MRTLLTTILILALLPAAVATAQPRSEKAAVDIQNRQAPKPERIQRKLNAARDLFLGKSEYGIGYQAATYDQSIQLIEEAIAIDRDRANTYYQAAKVIRDFHGRSFEARRLEKGYLEQYASRTDRKDPDWGRAHLRMAILDYVLDPDDIDERERHLLDAYNAMLDYGDLMDLGTVEELLAGVASERQDFESATRYLRGALRHGVDSPVETATALARCLALSGDPEAGLQELEDWLNDHGLDDQMYFSHGIGQLYVTFQFLHTRLGNYDTALQYIDAWESMVGSNSVMRSGPNNPMVSVHDARAGVYFAMGEYHQAETWWRKALELSPGDPTMMNNVAWAVVVQSDINDPALEEAVQLAEQATEIDPRAAYLDTLAEVYFRLERYADAIDAIDAAIDLRPEEPYLQEQRQKFVDALNGNPWQGTGHIRTVERWIPPDGTTF